MVGSRGRKARLFHRNVTQVAHDEPLLPLVAPRPTNNLLGADQANAKGSELWLASQVSTWTATFLHNTIAGLGPGTKTDTWEERRRIRLGLDPTYARFDEAGQGIYLGDMAGAVLTNTIIAGYDGAGLYAGTGSTVRLSATLWPTTPKTSASTSRKPSPPT